MQQVVQIDEFGRPQTIRGTGIDLLKIGACTMKRISEIELCSTTQEYFIRLPTGQCIWNHFTSYDQAVAGEIEYFNKQLATGCKI